MNEQIMNQENNGYAPFFQLFLLVVVVPVLWSLVLTPGQLRFYFASLQEKNLLSNANNRPLQKFPKKRSKLSLCVCKIVKKMLSQLLWRHHDVFRAQLRSDVSLQGQELQFLSLRS